MKTVWAKTLDELFEEDKWLLKKVKPKVSFDEQATYAESKGVEHSVHMVVFDSYGWDTRRQKVDLVQASAALERVRPKVESAVGFKIEGSPKIEVAPIGDFCRRAEELADQYWMQLSMLKPNRPELGTSMWFGGLDLVLVCEERSYRTDDRSDARARRIRSGDEMPLVGAVGFSKAELDYALAAGLCSYAILQARGQSGDAHFSALREQGPRGRNAGSDMRQIGLFAVMAGSVAEEKSWILPYLSEKPRRVWSAKNDRAQYQGLLALIEAEGAAAAMQGLPVFHPIEKRGARVKLGITYCSSDEELRIAQERAEKSNLRINDLPDSSGGQAK